ncbi:MAG: serine/threonine protein kinase, partial [Verrucomicrobia bacterium]|nr:serine/threonine protein kinase [Verrucomicrobiota bacterium]
TTTLRVDGGRFLLKRQLGRGGMGIVWLAYDERLRREVALKLLPPQIRFDAASLDDLRRETSRSQKLTHPNILRIHDLHEPEGETPFISMEYVNGSDLGSLRVARPERTLTWDFLKQPLVQLCEALICAHAEGIVHRDLKPANIMIDQAGRLKLADFGIARAMTDTLSRSSVGQTSGTLLYMSPQQLDGSKAQPTDDIYGIGTTFYELFTSKPPFFTGDLLHQIRTSPPKPFQERLEEFGLKNEIPAHIEELILTCLSKQGSERPQSAQEILQWIESGKRPAGSSRPPGKQSGALSIKVARSTTLSPKSLVFASVAAALIGVGIWQGSRGPKDVVKTAARPLEPASPPAALAPTGIAAPARPVATAAIPTIIPAPTPAPTPTTNTAITSTPPVEPPPPPPPSPQPSPEPASLSAPQKTATALQLARQGNTYITERSRGKVLEIHSERILLDSPTQRWQVVYYDPQAPRKSVEVRFEDGQMVRVREPGGILEFLSSSSPKPLELEKVKIDSDEALRIALRLVGRGGDGIRSSESDLERGYAGAVMWKIRLYGALPGQSGDSSLGYANIFADDGRVLKETFTKKLSRTK